MTQSVRAPGRLWRRCAALLLGVPVLLAWDGTDPSPAQATAQGECTSEDPQLISEPAPALEALGIAEAWRYTDGDGVVVAVIDSGVSSDNAHFDGALVPGVNVVDDSQGADQDLGGHGTAAAGIIGARPVSGSAVVGVAPGAQIQPVRVYYEDTEEAEDTDVHITPQRMADGIRWAAENGAGIINVSMNTTEDHPDLAAAVATAAEHGALVVASSGNRNTSDIDENVPRYPASYEGVLAVSPVDTNGQWRADAAYESDVVDVAAPGQHVPTAFFGDGDCILQPFEAPPSTSWATAYVSGAAALIAAEHPQEGPQEWAYRLQATASRASTGTADGRIGWGIIRPLQALEFVDDGTAVGPESPRHGEIAAEPSATADENRTVSDDPIEPAAQATRWWVAGALVAGAVMVGALWLRRRTRPGPHSAGE